MAKLISLPADSPGTGLGLVLNALFYVINETETSQEKVIWDFGNGNGRLESLHPFLIGPLSIYRQRAAVPIEIRLPSDRGSMGSLNHHFLDKPLEFQAPNPLLENVFSCNEYQYTPLTRFDVSTQTELIQTSYQKMIQSQNCFNRSLLTPLSYLLSELMDNMVEHSLAKSGYIFSQFSRTDNVLDICLADDGISIFGSFMLKRKDIVEEHNNNEAKILKLATEGVSTKNLPFGQHRGFGLPTSKKMLVEGLGGNLCILSGNAFHWHSSKSHCSVNLPPSISWPGTMILLRIPMELPSRFNYINYIQ